MFAIYAETEEGVSYWTIANTREAAFDRIAEEAETSRFRYEAGGEFEDFEEACLFIVEKRFC